MRSRTWALWLLIPLVLYAHSLKAQTVYSYLCYPDTACHEYVRALWSSVIDNHLEGDFEYPETYYYVPESDSSYELFHIPNWYMFELRGDSLVQLQRANVVRVLSKHSPLVSRTKTVADFAVRDELRIKAPSDSLKLSAFIKGINLKREVDKLVKSGKKRKDAWKQVNKKSKIQ